MEHPDTRTWAPASRLRLAWDNPRPLVREEPGDEPRAAGLRLVPPAKVPGRPVKLDLAIERHLAGADGLPRDEFLLVFAGRATRVPVPALS